MADRLFGIPFSRWADKHVAPYIDQIKQVHKDRLTDETINDLISKAVNSEKLIIPILNREKTHAKRLDTQYLAVHVPVSHNIELLHIEPTEFIIPSSSAYTQKDELVITLRDDDRLENELDSFLGEVRNNLSSLDRDLSRLKMRLNESIMTIARSRRTEIEEMAARDRRRSFPVR